MARRKWFHEEEISVVYRFQEVTDKDADGLYTEIGGDNNTVVEIQSTVSRRERFRLLFHEHTHFVQDITAGNRWYQEDPKLPQLRFSKDEEEELCELIGQYAATILEAAWKAKEDKYAKRKKAQKKANRRKKSGRTKK